MSIAPQTDYNKEVMDMTKSLLGRLISDGLENGKSTVKYFRPLIEECIKYAKTKEPYKIDNQHFSNVIFLVNETKTGLEYFKRLNVVDDITIDVFKKLLSLFNEWKTVYDKNLEYKLEEEDKFIRLQAEFENYKKRVHKERSTLESQIKYNTLSGILDIIDDLGLAKKNEANNEGVQLIFSKLETYLQKQGVVEVDCVGDFDAEIHECLTVVNNGKEMYNKIVGVAKKGYSINGVIVRYPKVIVSK